MLLHAGEYYDAAEPAYLNAQDLAPQDARWPYLLGHLHKSKGNPSQALVDFTRALEITPNDVPTLIWLGRLYLDQGQPEKAQPLFERARRWRRAWWPGSSDSGRRRWRSATTRAPWPRSRKR